MKTKHVRLELPESQHQRLRVAAAKQGLSMTGLVRRLVNGYLNGPRPKGSRAGSPEK
jgi:hypothetical protein